MFISEDIEDEVVGQDDGIFVAEVFESIVLKIKHKIDNHTTKDITLVVIYCQPNNSYLSTFINELEKTLKKYARHRGEMIVVGDTNLNLLTYDKYEMTAKFLDTMQEHNLITRITRPTRIKHQSATLIDIIFSRDNEQTLIS